MEYDSDATPTGVAHDRTGRRTVTFLIILTLILAAFAWDAVSKVKQRREAERAARAAYYQAELDYQRRMRDAADARARMVRSTERLAAKVAAERHESLDDWKPRPSTPRWD